MRSISVLLVDIYDMVVKYESDYNEKIEIEKEEGTKMEEVENEEKDAFYKYLMQSEQMNEQELFDSMAKKGLIFKWFHSFISYYLSITSHVQSLFKKLSECSEQNIYKLWYAWYHNNK